MTTKAAFSPEEWTVVLEGPPAAAGVFGMPPSRSRVPAGSHGASQSARY